MGGGGGQGLRNTDSVFVCGKVAPCALCPLARCCQRESSRLDLAPVNVIAYSGSSLARVKFISRPSSLAFDNREGRKNTKGAVLSFLLITLDSWYLSTHVYDC